MKLIEQLQKLMPLAANATEGPWAFTPNGDYDGWSMIREADSANYHQIGADACDFASVGHITDAAFIAAARNLLTPEHLTMIIGLLGNMESSFETNRVLVKRLFDIQGILENDLLDDTKLYLISETINPPKIAKR